MKYVLALDQGTTSSRAILFGHDGKIIGVAQHCVVVEQHASDGRVAREVFVEVPDHTARLEQERIEPSRGFRFDPSLGRDLQPGLYRRVG